jgi:hypothetical protein
MCGVISRPIRWRWICLCAPTRRRRSGISAMNSVISTLACRVRAVGGSGRIFFIMSNPFLASFALHVLQPILNDRTLRNSEWCSSRSRTRRLLGEGRNWWWWRERDESQCWLRCWDYERGNGLDDDSSWHCSLGVNDWNSRCSRNDGVCCW